MPYTKTIWNNGAAPGISADKLNNIENKIEELDTFATTVNNELSDYNIIASNPDANGLYTVVEYRRLSDNTIYLKTTLSNLDENMKYQTLSLDYYNSAGTSVIKTESWGISYDTNGKVIGLEVI